MSRNALFPIFAVVFIDLLGFSIILPLLPYYAGTFGAGAVEVGLLVAVYAAAQFAGASVLGRLSDRYGRRPVLMVSIAGAGAGFLMLAAATSLWMMYASRLVAGLFGGNISVAQAYITDVTDARNRSKGLGIIGAAFGLGFILGPAAGGVLSNWGFALPALVAAGLSVVNLLAVAFLLPESLTPERRSALERGSGIPLTMVALRTALRRPLVGTFLRARFFFSLAFSTFQSVFVLYAQYRLGLSAQETGYVLAYVGVLSVIVQGFLVGRLAAAFDDSELLFGGTVVMALAMIGWAAAPSVEWLLLVLAPLSAAGGLLNTVLSSALTRVVRPEEYGGMLGLASSVESTTRVVSPIVGGVLIQYFGTASPGIASAAVLAGLAYYLWETLMDGGERLPGGGGSGRGLPEPVLVRVEVHGRRPRR